MLCGVSRVGYPFLSWRDGLVFGIPWGSVPCGLVNVLSFCGFKIFGYFCMSLEVYFLMAFVELFCSFNSVYPLSILSVGESQSGF